MWFEWSHDLTDLLVACAFPAAVAAGAKRAPRPDGVVDRQLLYEHMHTARQRAAERAHGAAGRSDARGTDSDLPWFVQPDPNADQLRRDR